MKYLYLVLISVLMLCGCSKKQTDESSFNPHVAAFTAGTVSIQSRIVVKMAQPIVDIDNGDVSMKLFDIKPSLKGKVVKTDDETFEFIPSEMMKPATKYTVKFKVNKVLKKVETKDKEFTFSFNTITTNYGISNGGLVLNDGDAQTYKLEFEIITSDYADNAEVEKMVKISPSKFKTSWIHNSSQSHVYTIENIASEKSAYEIILSVDGNSIGAEKKEEVKVRVPSIDEFSILNIEIVNEEKEQSIICRFSTAIDPKQNLTGLITIQNNKFTYRVFKNIITLYPVSRISKQVQITIHKGLASMAGGKLQESHTEDLSFEDLKPQVKFTGKGSILPSSNSNLIVPFQAVALKAVEIRVIKIYESNVMQFLQVNKIDGKKELKRAGRLIKYGKMRLNDTKTEKELKFWNTFAYDLSKDIEAEPGAIYRVEISFNKKDAIIDCDSGSGEGENAANLSEQEPTLESLQAEYDNNYNPNAYFYDYDYDYYDYDEYSPCDDYYYKVKKVAKNILASDLGIIAKAGGDNMMRVNVTNLLDISPISGVSVEAFNFQQQPLGKGTTSADGVAEFKFTGKPYFLVAKNGNQRGYMQMYDPLSLSRFDVGGEVISKGIKGDIYGERGIWRPGDTIFLGFVLKKDPHSELPANHPVNLEITNARGQIVNKQTKTAGENGFYTFFYQTDDAAPTGNWTAKIKVGGTTFTKTLKVETIKPNRLKINLEFDNDPILLNKPVSGKLKSTWLHGSPAKNLKAEIIMMLTNKVTTFKGYESYVFQNPQKSFSESSKVFYTGKLDSDGFLSFSKEIKPDSWPSGKLNANFITRVFEEGGEFSIDNAVQELSPYDTYVGLLRPKGTGYAEMLETDKNQIFEVISVDSKGKLKDESVEVKIYKLGWSWWWSSNVYSTANYAQSRYKDPVYKTNIKTSNGRATFSYKAPHNSYGTYFVEVTNSNGHSAATTVYIDWPEWGNRPRQGDDGDGAAMLMFSTDKEKYNVGEKAVVSLPTTAGCKALISIENGTKVLQSYWVDTKDKQTDITIDVTDKMVPNVYVFATLIQPHAQTKNDSPIRMYGVVPIIAEDPETKLSPVIDMTNTVRPEETYKVKVSEAKGKPMTYTLAVVDDGLLDLTRFKTPNPWNVFYAREALGVTTWDMYNDVLGAYGGKIEQLFAIGGDMSASGNRPKINRFKPVVTFIGPFTIDKGKSKEHTLNMPNYVGSVRVMVVAGNEKAYGSAEKTVPVKKPLMVLATLPRVLGPGEEVSLPATVFAMEPNIKNVDVSIEANDIFTVEKNRASLNFSSIGDQIANFKLKVKEKAGKGTVKVTATSGGEKSTYEIEIEIRNPNPYLTKTESVVLEAGKTLQSALTIHGMEGTNTAVIEASFIPPLNLASRLGYLLRYPHGCLEQTTSAAFPQLYLSSVIELKTEDKKAAERNINAALNKLKGFTTSDGGFSYWQGDRYANLWTSSYVGDFIIESEKKGYTLPSGMKESWVKFQQNAARNWTKDKKDGRQYTQNDLDQAYRLYTLAKAKTPEMGAMNRLKEQQNLSVQARWALAAAYALAGKDDVAKNIISSASIKVPEYESSFSSSFGSTDRDKSMIVDALLSMKEYGKAFELVREISVTLNSEQWMSTQTSAYCLMAISRYAETLKENKAIDIEYKYGGKTEQVTTGKPIWKGELGKLSKSDKIEIVNKGDNLLYIQTSTIGIPVAGDEKASESGMKIAVSYNISNVEKLQQGTDFTATVTVSNTSLQRLNYSNISLSQIFPSGWEILNNRLFGLEESSGYDYCDIRDDRVYTYFGLEPGLSKKFKVNLNAAYCGRFYLPATKAEAMYDGKINANTAGMWVEIVK